MFGAIFGSSGRKTAGSEGKEAEAKAAIAGRAKADRGEGRPGRADREGFPKGCPGNGLLAVAHAASVAAGERPRGARGLRSVSRPQLSIRQGSRRLWAERIRDRDRAGHRVSGVSCWLVVRQDVPADELFPEPSSAEVAGRVADEAVGA